MPEFTSIDYLAFAWFILCWVGYTALADHSRWRTRSITAEMNRQRRHWMAQMLARDLRMVDTQIMGNLLHGISFFASTTILVVAGLVAILGAADQAIGALADLPFATPPSRPVWEVKVLLMIGIFVYAFFKLAWAFRLTKNCAILIGAAPPAPVEEAEAERHIARTSAVSSLAAHHFNRGLRAYFFALAALGWFLSPAIFAVGSAWVAVVLYRREFRSRALRTIRSGPQP